MSCRLSPAVAVPVYAWHFSPVTSCCSKTTSAFPPVCTLYIYSVLITFLRFVEGRHLTLPLVSSGMYSHYHCLDNSNYCLGRLSQELAVQIHYFRLEGQRPRLLWWENALVTVAVSIWPWSADSLSWCCSHIALFLSWLVLTSCLKWLQKFSPLHPILAQAQHFTKGPG